MTTAPAPAVSASADVTPPTRYAHSRTHIKSYYGLNITRGMPVIFEGQPGRVTGLNGQYLLVRLDNQAPNTRPLLCHPTWRMAYPTLGIEATQ